MSKILMQPLGVVGTYGVSQKGGKEDKSCKEVSSAVREGTVFPTFCTEWHCQILSCGSVSLAAMGGNQNWRWAPKWEALVVD